MNNILVMGKWDGLDYMIRLERGTLRPQDCSSPREKHPKSMKKFIVDAKYCSFKFPLLFLANVCVI